MPNVPLRRTAIALALALAAAGLQPAASAPPARPPAAAEPLDAPPPQVSWSEPSPEAKILEEALDHLRKWEVIAAQELLEIICPEFTDGAAEGTTLEDLSCAARAVSFGEVKGLKDSADRADGYWWAGERARRTKRADISRAFFEVALERNPKDSDIWASVGRLRRDVGDLQGSSEALDRAIALDATNLEAAYWLAANRMDRNDPAKAEELLQRIVAADRKFGRAWYRLGLLRQKQGKHEEAIDFLEKARSHGVDAKIVAERVAESRRALPGKRR